MHYTEKPANIETNRPITASLSHDSAIRKIERRVERERSQAMVSVLAAPYAAVKGLMAWRGAWEQLDPGPCGHKA